MDNPKPKITSKDLRIWVVTFLAILSILGSYYFPQFPIKQVTDIVSTAIPTFIPEETIVPQGISAYTNLTDLVLSGTLAVTGASTFTGATTSGITILTATALTPATGSTLTPTASFYIIHTTGNITMTLGTTATAGQVIYLYGDDANTITINDTNILTHDGAALSIGQYDMVGMIYMGTKWVQFFEVANS